MAREAQENMRIGITGHQRLKDQEWVQHEIDSLLAELPSPLTGISSLAAGADQLFANAILKHGGSLEAVIPFAGYERVFVADRDREEFKRLLGLATNAETLETEGSAEEAYLAAGKRVVDVADLVVAVWDGKPAAGLGGTGDVVKYAAQQGKKIIHLNPITKTRRDYIYDVFVSYRDSWPDRSCVLNQLIPALDKAGLRVWVYKRDGPLKEDLFEQTESVIRSSRYAICVVSPSYKRKLKTRAGMVAIELQSLLELYRDREGPPPIPLWLRGRQIPIKLKDFPAIDWRKSANRAQEWKRLLTNLDATNPESPVPGRCPALYICNLLQISTYVFCITLLIGALLFLGSKQIQPPPVRLAIQKIDGADVYSEAPVPSLGSVAGTVEGQIAAGSRVAIYKQTIDQDHSDLWELAGSTFLDGQNWIVAGVQFRPPLTSRRTRTTIQALVLTSEPQDTLYNDELAQLKKHTGGELSSVIVDVPNPQVTMSSATLDHSGDFSASGSARDILAGQEELYFELYVESSIQHFHRNFNKPDPTPDWSASYPVKEPFKAGDRYTIQVFLGPPEFNGVVNRSSFVPFGLIRGSSR